MIIIIAEDDFISADIFMLIFGTFNLSTKWDLSILVKSGFIWVDNPNDDVLSVVDSLISISKNEKKKVAARIWV